MMNHAARIFLLISVGLLEMGTVVKKKDAIQLTQTDPVAYQEKVKEEAEGKKRPPVPTLELFPKERFLTEGPVEKGKEARGVPEGTDSEFWLEEDKTGETSEEWEEGEFKLEPQTDDTWEERKPPSSPVSHKKRSG